MLSFLPLSSFIVFHIESLFFLSVLKLDGSKGKKHFPYHLCLGDGIDVIVMCHRVQLLYYTLFDVPDIACVSCDFFCSYIFVYRKYTEKMEIAHFNVQPYLYSNLYLSPTVNSNIILEFYRIIRSNYWKCCL